LFILGILSVIEVREFKVTNSSCLLSVTPSVVIIEAKSEASKQARHGNKA